VARVTLMPSGWVFDAAPTDTLLLAAQRAGIRLARSCRNGTCRACLSRVRAGEIAHTIEWPGLSADEKAEGCVLPCVARAVSDALTLESPGAVRIEAPAGGAP